MHQKGVLDVADVVRHGIVARFAPLTFEIVHDAAHRNEIRGVVHQEHEDVFEQFRVADAVALDDVAQQHRVLDGGDVVAFQFGARQGVELRQSSTVHVFRVARLVRLPATDAGVFRKAEREYLEADIASREQRGEFA